MTTRQKTTSSDAVKAPRRRTLGRGLAEIKFELRVVAKSGTKLWDSFDSLGRAKRIAARLTEAGIASAIVKVTKKLIWHHSQG